MIVAHVRFRASLLATFFAARRRGDSSGCPELSLGCKGLTIPGMRP
jgi:hypothetical protein